MEEKIYSQEKVLIDIYNEILKESVEFNDTNYEYENGISDFTNNLINEFIKDRYNIA